MCNVIPVKCKRVSTHTLMFWAGLGNVIFSFLCVPLPKLDLVTLFHPYQLGNFKDNLKSSKVLLFYTYKFCFTFANMSYIYFSEWFQWLIIIVLGFLAVAINQLLILANVLASPTVNSMVGTNL